MTTKRIIDVNTAARAQGKVPAWDVASGTHVYVSPSAYALTAPTFVAAGTSSTGTGDVTPGLPAGHTLNDILLLFVHSCNQAVTAPAGWAQLGPDAGFGAAAAAGSMRLTVFWKRDNGSESDPTVTDTGDHTLAQIIAIRGCPTTGDPFLCVGATQPKRTASTIGTANAGVTQVDACLVVNAFAHALDSASAVFSGWTNASLASITERIDVATADGNGGGIGVATGVMTKAGSFVATTVTETSTTDVSLTFLMLPADIVGRNGLIDRQVFVNTVGTPTWTKPTGAKSVTLTAIGAGGSGSAGRNAATAAGGGGGGGGAFDQVTLGAASLPATLTVTVGAGGAATANTDGAVGNNGGYSYIAGAGGAAIGFASFGSGGAASASGSGGAGGSGGGGSSGVASPGAFTIKYGGEPAPGGTGGTTAAAGSHQMDFGGGGGGGGGTTQAGAQGGVVRRGGGGGGGGRANTNVGTGGGGLANVPAGGGSAGASGADSAVPEYGGAGGAGGTSAAGPGGGGGWPGGGGGGGGSQSGAQRGGAGADGVVVIVTHC